MHRRTTILGLLALAVAPQAFANYVGRRADAHTLPLSVDGEGLALRYQPAPAPRLACTDLAGGRVLFDVGVPALRHLWIAPGGRHVVALSEGSTQWDQDRVLVFARDGAALLDRPIEGVPHALRNAALDTPELPFVALTAHGKGWTVTVRNRAGETLAFDFADRA